MAILDADKEGFLRSDTSLIQTIGRAARNSNGQVILYADHITGSIERAIQETTRRRDKQLAHNKKHGITPKTIQKEIRNMLEEFGISSTKEDRTQRGLGASKKHGTLSLDLLGDARSVKEIIKEKESICAERYTLSRLRRIFRCLDKEKNKAEKKRGEIPLGCDASPPMLDCCNSACGTPPTGNQYQSIRKRQGWIKVRLTCRETFGVSGPHHCEGHAKNADGCKFGS